MNYNTNHTTPEYYENAKIVTFDALPKVGEEKKDAFSSSRRLVCVELKIWEFTSDYIIYKALFCEADSLHILDDFFINCATWFYAVPNFKKPHQKGGA